jgi:hypothetical protein
MQCVLRHAEAGRRTGRRCRSGRPFHPGCLGLATPAQLHEHRGHARTQESFPMHRRRVGSPHASDGIRPLARDADACHPGRAASDWGTIDANMYQESRDSKIGSPYSASKSARVIPPNISITLLIESTSLNGCCPVEDAGSKLQLPSDGSSPLSFPWTPPKVSSDRQAGTSNGGTL